MTRVTFQDGKIVFRDGKAGTESGCCCGGNCCFLCGCTVTVTVELGGNTFTGEIVLNNCIDGYQAFGTGLDEAGGVGIGQQWIGGGNFADFCTVTCPIGVWVSGNVIAWSNYNLSCESCCEPLYGVGEFGNWAVPCEFPQAGQYFNQTPIGVQGQNCTLELLEFFETEPFVGTFQRISIDSINCDPCENPLP